MANKSSSIARKLWLANGSAVLAIASLFSIGFSAWAEVGGETTINLGSNINISVQGHGGAELLDTSYSTPFVIYPTGCSQVEFDDSSTNRTYTTTPYLTFYLFFKFAQTNISCDFSFNLDYENSNEKADYTKCFIPKTGFEYYEALSIASATSTMLDNLTAVNTTATNSITVINNTNTYYSMKIKWYMDIPLSYSDFYTNIGQYTHTFTLSVDTEV